MLPQEQWYKMARHHTFRMEITGRFLITKAVRFRSSLSRETVGQEALTTLKVSLDKLIRKLHDVLTVVLRKVSLTNPIFLIQHYISVLHIL